MLTGMLAHPASECRVRCVVWVKAKAHTKLRIRENLLPLTLTVRGISG